MKLKKSLIAKAALSGFLAAPFLCANSEQIGNKNPITSEMLGGKTRMLNYLSTDKPIYREKEKIYLRSVFLNAKDNFPIDVGYGVNFTIKGPKGDVITTLYSNLQDSTAGAYWEIPQGQAGGEYTVLSSTNGYPEAERKFEIRAYQPPRLKTQIEFLRKGYGAGDLVKATVNIKRAEGGIPETGKVTAIARVDGIEVFRKPALTIDSEGNCSTEFNLPEQIAVGDGTLSFVIEDGGVKETASKTIPILLQNMDIAFYPEGGELVAGIKNRVYIQALRPDGKPADIKGYIVETGKKAKKEKAQLELEVKTEHEGRGLFSFTPEKGKYYALKLQKPSGIENLFILPEVKNKGVALDKVARAYEFDQKIQLDILSTKNSKAAKVTLRKREELLDSAKIESGIKSTVKLDAQEAEGVLMLTVWDKDDAPLAERLIFRKPKFRINIKITPKADEFVPGGTVDLNIETTNEQGSPVSAVVGLTVTDESVLEMIDKREQAPSLPVMVYLENEVKELADAEVYFDSENPDAEKSIDLLLGTQGWRRFIIVNYNGIAKDFEKAARRAMAQMDQRVYKTRARKDVRFLAGAAPEGLNKMKGINEPPPMAMPMAAIPQDDAKADIVEEAEINAVVVPLPDEMKQADEEILATPPLAEKPMFAKKEAQRIHDGNYIREYAHQVRFNRQPNDRVDFTETVYWNAGIKTNPRNGKATVSFDLSDNITSFKVMADAFGNNGALGNGATKIESLEPFYIEPKLPTTMTVGDILKLPVNLVNSTKNELDNVSVVVKGKGLRIKQAQKTKLKAGERKRVIVEITADMPGDYDLTINSAAGTYTDNISRKIKFEANGFPMQFSKGGLVSADNNAEMVINMPESFEIGSVTTEAKVYPSPLANMEDALNALLRQPHGCFEQTSSTNYPLVMAQQYFTTHTGIAPEKIKEAQDLLEKGYKRLTGFESKGKGYEWFGYDPAHEALTAYGLMEFSDMSQFMQIDSEMLQRTREWLLSRRDGKGGFKRNQKALDSFGGAPEPTTNAYIIWALLESGESPEKLQKEIAAIKKTAEKSKDSYVIALAANIMYLANDAATGDKFAKTLAGKMDKDGMITGANSSITRSYGDSLEVETTSLAILAFMKNSKKFAADTEKAMKWLFKKCESGRFGSTQSTILALKAINAYDKARSKPKNPGKLQLVINGKNFGKPLSFDKDSKDAILLPDFSAAISSGKHNIKLIMTDGSEMPFSIAIKYKTALPASSDKTFLTLDTTLSANKIVEGEPLEVKVKVTVLDKEAPTPIAVIGIPSGLEVRHDQLKELVASKRVDSYEIIGRNLVLYWRGLKAKSVTEIPVSLIARVPGKFTAPASAAYLYYSDEYKDWQKGMEIEVTASKK